jgi:hypothetical protein
MAKKVDPLKAKEKKQKIIAAVGGVILLALVAWQVPKVMKQLNKKPPVSSATTSTTAAPPAGTPSLAAPTLSGNEQATPTTPTGGSGSLVSGDVPPPLQTGQLESFSRFESKDPFAQQLSDTNTTSGTPSSSGSGTSGGSSSPGSTPPSGGVGSGGGSGSQPGPGSAVLSVNGTLISVSVGTDFPQPTTADPGTQPIFHLIALTAHTAKISIVGGSYSNGAQAITLHENKPLTLMNTADGTKYKLVLKPQGTPLPGQVGGTGTTTTPTVTLPPATP